VTRKGLIAVFSIGFVILIVGIIFWTPSGPLNETVATTTPKLGHPVRKLADCLSIAALPIEHRESSFATPRAFNPDCQEDAACEAWRRFREARPYPYQAFAGHRLPEGRAVLVLSEPPPDITHAQAISLLTELFADRKPTAIVKRWMIGSDGYVEDLVATFDAPELTSDDVLSDSDLRDRIALLQQAWFGTACGGDVEVIGSASLSRASGIAPNLQVSAAELSGWLGDPKLLWTRIEDARPVGYNWGEISGDDPLSGAFVTADGTLTLFTFAKSALDDAAALAALRDDFRRFAVSSDSIVGAVWNDAGRVGLVGRARSHPLSQIPPLRFETFVLLAKQRGDELSQSYERTNPMAGKMPDTRDWAPIYLSPPLIDSELGALLNITDQMLKSWSEAGRVDYLYFHYPLKPNVFPFDRPLSEIIHDETKSSETLFNWNTSGAAVGVKSDDMTIMVSRQSGALPVTYGAEVIAGGPVVTGQLRGKENTAYDYFASLGDPDLARVQQYTLIYQALRGVEGEHDVPPQDTQQSPQTAYLADNMRTLLHAIGDGTLRADPTSFAQLESPGAIAALSGIAAEAVKEFRGKHPQIDDTTLSDLLADRIGGIAALFSKGSTFSNIGDPVVYQQNLRRDEDAFDRDVAQVNAHGGATESEKAVFDARVQELKAREAKLAATEQSEKELVADLDPVSRAVKEVVQITQDLGSVHDMFEQKAAHQTPGWIKTPSTVVSWGATLGARLTVGGHNLDARTLPIEPSNDVQGIVLKDDRILYNPDQSKKVEAHATELGRAIEHEGVTTQTEIDQIVARDAPAPRTRPDALMEADAGPSPGVARLGGRTFESSGEAANFVTKLRVANPCCRFAIEGKDGYLYMGERNPLPPPTAVARIFGDTASFSSYLRENAARGAPDLIMLEQPRAHVEALLAGLDMPDDAASAISLIKRRWIGLFDRLSGRTDHLIGGDMRGRSGAISMEADGRAVVERARTLSAQAGSAKVTELDAATTEKLLLPLGWDVARDGEVSAIRASFSGGGGGGGGTIDVIAGFSEGGRSSNQQRLLSIVSKDADDGAARNANYAQVLMTIKNDLQRLPDAKLKRLSMHLRTGSASMQMTELASPRSFYGAG